MDTILNGLRKDLGKGGAGLVQAGDPHDLYSYLATLGAIMHSPVADETALAAIEEKDRADGMILLVGAALWYRDDSSSAGASAGSVVVSDDSATGRWLILDSDATLKALLASTANGKGASLVSIEDAAGNTAQTTVEGALAELYGFNKTKVQAISGQFTAGSLTINTGIVVTASTKCVGVVPIVRGGTFPAGGFQSLTSDNVVGAAGVGTVVITARKSDGTLENLCTDTVAALLVG